MVLNRVRELVGHPGEIVNKAHLYDQLMETADPSSARQTLQILVKYSRSMKDLLRKYKNSCLRAEILGGFWTPEAPNRLWPTGTKS
jgi:hypothetical protein